MSQLLGHLKGHESPIGVAPKKIRSLRLYGPNLLDVVNGHVLDGRGNPPAIETVWLEPIIGLIWAQIVCHATAAVHAEKWRLGALRLDRD